MKKICTLFFVLITPFVCLAASDTQPKVEPKAEDVLKRVSNFYHGMKSFSADMSISMQVQGP